MVSRRKFLSGGVLALLSGCIGSNFGEGQNGGTSTPTNVSALEPPWDRVDSQMDIAVDNWMESSIVARVEFDDYLAEETINSSSAWVSGNIISPDTSPNVTLTVDDDRGVTAKWESEEDNENYLKFNVYSDKITFEIGEKGDEMSTSNTRTQTP